MESTPHGKAIPFKDALRIFWDWHRASIAVEVCFFCRPGSSEDVRVSIDGLVNLLDNDGNITVSGDGREIDLDLRGSEVTYAREVPAGLGQPNSLDPDSILQVKFPSGEICLIFPYRRVGSALPGQRRPETGLEWMRNMLPRTAEQDSHATKLPGGVFKISSLAKRSGTASKPRTSRTGPPLFPMGAFLLLFLLITLALTPSGVPRLLGELGVPQKMSDPSATVWVIPQDGDYYCNGSVLNGRKPGKWMTQAEALAFGYQPAIGHYCQAGGTSSADNRGNGFLNYYQAVRHNGEALFSRLVRISYSWLPQT
ncbi:MAG TPA: hypothetical protein VNJ52_07755 [Patescibacteria group bacterium]|nr:hypothetical protein [Patescibacteria group bacterium]